MRQIAVVGAGYWGPNIIRNFYENPNCILAAVCDKDPEKLAHLKKNYGERINLVTDYQSLLDNPEIDGIAVVTDIPSHIHLAKAALEHGKHVFVEKPLAMTSDECLTLGKLAEDNQRMLMVGHTFLYNPAVHKLKEIADSGTLGDIYYMTAQRVNLGRIQTTFNALWSLAVHDVSIALYLFGERPSSVRAWGNAFITPGVEDVAFMNLSFPSGKLAHIHASWLDPEKKRQVTLVGSRQMVVYDDVSQDRKITLYDKGINKVLHDTEHTEYQDFSGFQLQARSGDITIPKLKFTEPLKLECQHFIDCMNGLHDKPVTGWREGYEVVRVLEVAHESLKLGGAPVDINWKEHAVYASV